MYAMMVFHVDLESSIWIRMDGLAQGKAIALTGSVLLDPHLAGDHVAADLVTTRRACDATGTADRGGLRLGGRPPLEPWKIW